MIFEDALAKMREGKKITHESLGEDVYLQACRVGFVFEHDPQKELPMSVVKMKGEQQHEDMRAGNIDSMCNPGILTIKEEVFDQCKHGSFPQLNLLLIMCDDWEIYGET